MNITLLGAGMVGSAIALDLQKKHSVMVADKNSWALNRLLDKGFTGQVFEADLSDESLYPGLVSKADLVVSAVPGFMGFATLSTLITLGKDVVDISFFPEDALSLQEAAKRSGVTVIMDCGVAPGLSNLVLGYCDSRMQVQRFDCVVGGLPKERSLPFAYKAPFSPIDVLEEYTRPARYVEAGQVVTRPALSDPEWVEVPGIGTLESFNTDGLRSILYTMAHIPHMKEKTLRYPGHRGLIESLLQAGFFDDKPRMLNGHLIRPIDMTASVLFSQWALKDSDDEFTYMKMTVEGIKENQPVREIYTLYDERDPLTGISSMSRTTGYTCTAAVHLIESGLFTQKGVYPPELVGAVPGCFEAVLKHLSERAVQVQLPQAD